MIKKCKISIKKIDIIIELKNNKTSREIWKALPIKSFIKRWGKEIYFACNIDVELDNENKSVINYGEIAFWPKGNCIAIGYGKTPISVNQEIRLADRCNIWGKSKCDLHKLDLCFEDDPVTVKKIE